MNDSPDRPDAQAALAANLARVFGDPIVQSLVFILAVAAFFLLFPHVDVWFSGLFFEPGAGFPMSRLPAFTGLRSIGEWLVRLTVLAVLGAVILKLARPTRPSLIAPRDVIFVLSTLIVGPGILVNLVLKDHWGRPRPVMVSGFGGTNPFVGIWPVSDYCASNCSFVAGEGSSALWLLTLAIIAPPAWRPVAARVLIPLAVLLSFNRIAVGGHFLSDVLLAWGLTALVMIVAYRLIIERPPQWLANDRLEAGLAEAGLALRRLPERLRGDRPPPPPSSTPPA